ncbi:MAG: asparagine synthase-related protein [Desulfobacteraceae bacterium]
MAGIVGVIKRDLDIREKKDPIVVGKMLDILRHRGPDNTLIRSFSGGAVGCMELDTSPRSTYAFCAAGNCICLLDGLLYNSRRKNENNVQVLMDLYLEHGEACFSYLDGYFACAIMDEDKLLLARDPLGVRYLVYGTRIEEDNLYFASEAKALRDFVPSVELIPPGHYYSSKDDQVHSFKPYTPEPPDFDPEDEEGIAHVVKETMLEATHRLMEDQAIGGVALSGGFDSSVVAGIMAKEFGIKFPQFTATIKRTPGPDLHFSKLMAEYLQAPHYITEITDEQILRILPKAVWYLESFDQDCISGWIANYFTAKLAAKFTNCVFVGETADEIAGGYFGELEDFYDQWAEPDQRQAVYQKLIDIAGDTGLRRLNQGWHAASVEPRTPFPDPKLVALFQKIPMKYKYNENYDKDKGEVPEKWILRKALQEYLPPEIAWRKKMRFARGVGVDFLMDELAGSKVSQRQFEAMPYTPVSKIRLNSRKERYYYDLFIKEGFFPMSFENLTIRWDPFYET